MKEPGVELKAIALTLINSTVDTREYLFSLEVFNPVIGSQSAMRRENVQLTRAEVRAIKLRTAVILTFATTAVTEYLMPFLIALVPIACLPFI